LQISTV